VATCDPNNPGCAKRDVAQRPEFCGECGLARADYLSAVSGGTPPPSPPSAPRLSIPARPVTPRGSRPVLQMKPSDQPVAPPHQTAPQAPTTPLPAQEANTQPALTASQSNPAIARVLLAGAQQRSKTPSPPEPPAATPTQSASTPGAPKQPAKRRGRILVGLAVVAAIVGAAVVVVTQTDLLDRLTGSASPTTTVVGTVSDELLALAPNSPIELRLGPESVPVSNGGFSTMGTAEHTGLATLVAGEEILGVSLLPKSDSLITTTRDVSLESTALAMVLLRPEISDVYVVGDPIFDAAAQELLLQSDELQAVVSALRAEKDLEGGTFLRELSPDTQSQLDVAADWFRQRVSDGESEPVNLAAQYPRRTNNSRQETELRVSGLPQTCDEGLMPSSSGEADGLCFEVTSPKRADWENFTFDTTMEVAVKNLSPRAVALFLESDGSGRSFLGMVPPLDLTLPTASEILLKVFDGTTQYFNLAPDIDFDAEPDKTTTFVLDGAAATSLLTTVTFDYPGVPGVANPVFDQLASAADLREGRQKAAIITTLSVYFLPLLGVLLDYKEVKSPIQNGILAECPASFFTDLATSTIDISTSGADVTSVEFGALLDSEGAVPKLFWLAVATRYTGFDCENALANARVITGCLPTLRSFFEVLLQSASSFPDLANCLGDFRDELFDRLVQSAFKAGVKGIVNPLERADLGLVVLGSARSAAWSLRDAKRFADGDQYDLSTVTIPRWCYETAASRTRMFGVFNEFNIELSGNLIKNFRETVQGFLTLTTQLMEVGGNFTNETNWERESKAWSEIAAIGPPDVQPAAQRAADISAAIAQIIPDVKEAVRLSAELYTSDNALNKLALSGQLTLKVKDIEGSFSTIDNQINEGAADFERFDFSWRNTCPQSALGS
jgi:hypothetical protein